MAEQCWKSAYQSLFVWQELEISRRKGEAAKYVQLRVLLPLTLTFDEGPKCHEIMGGRPVLFLDKSVWVKTLGSQ